MKAIEMVREEIQRLYNPERVPIELRRQLVRMVKRAKRQGRNPRSVICETLQRR